MTREPLKVRRMLVPDKGTMFLDVDLAGADAQVVAWESGNEKLKTRFRNGAQIHVENARDLRGRENIPDDWKKTNPRDYDDFKHATHGFTYGAVARTIAQTVGWTVNYAEQFGQMWFSANPELKIWHKDTQAKLDATKTVTNKFGYRRVFFERNAFTAALAWVPQSTVARVCELGGIRVNKYLPWVEILMQVHDSLLLQIPTHKFDQRGEIHKVLRNPVPYDDPLTIPWGMEYSYTNWADLSEIKGDPLW